MDELIVFAPPGEGEVADAVIPMAEFEVEDAGEATVGEAQVPGGEVAVNDDAGSARERKTRDPLAGALQVPPEDTDTFRVRRLILG